MASSHSFPLKALSPGLFCLRQEGYLTSFGAIAGSVLQLVHCSVLGLQVLHLMAIQTMKAKLPVKGGPLEALKSLRMPWSFGKIYIQSLIGACDIYNGRDVIGQVPKCRVIGRVYTLDVLESCLSTGADTEALQYISATKTWALICDFCRIKATCLLLKLIRLQPRRCFQDRRVFLVQCRRSLGSAYCSEPITKQTIKFLEAQLGEDYSPSISRLKRR